MKLIRMRKQPIKRMNSWDFDAEVGERVIGIDGKVYDLCESRGRNKSAAGELTPVLARPHKKGARATKIDEGWYWEYE